MNPLRKKRCPGQGERCNEVYCLWLHKFDEVAYTPEAERKENRSGYVRCPEEWEISAVKEQKNTKVKE